MIIVLKVAYPHVFIVPDYEPFLCLLCIFSLWICPSAFLLHFYCSTKCWPSTSLSIDCPDLADVLLVVGTDLVLENMSLIFVAT